MNSYSEQQSINKLPSRQVGEQLIKSLALQIGFDACGVSSVSLLAEEKNHLTRWLSEGMNGEMGYMERNINKRIDPRVLVSNAKSVISVILNYYPGNPNISKNSPRISRYALSKDYHEVVKDKLHLLLELIRTEFGEVEGRVFVDSAPVLEKAWAVRSGLGWIGKNSLLINQDFGTFCFIGELVVDLEIQPNSAPVPNKCGSCTKCIDACPTGAIISPMVIDSRKCLSYITIEKKTPITYMEKSKLNGWCFGCDICQEVCPWNSKPAISKCRELKPKQEIINLSSDDLKSISYEKFNEIFRDTPLCRTSWQKFILNSNL